MGAYEDIAGVHVYRAEPVGEQRGALILVHEIWGLVGHIVDVADRFAAQGYLVLAPDLLSAVGITPQVGDELAALVREPDEAKRLAGQVVMRERTTPARDPEFARATLARLRALVDALAADEPRIAVTGFCFGGSYAYALAAADARVRAAVPFYGSAPDDDTLAQVRCPVLAFYGERDERLVVDLPRVRATAERAGLDLVVQEYGGVGHAFFNDTNALSYDATTAEDSWRRTLDFLATALR